MIGNNHAENNLEKRLRQHYQGCYAPPPDFDGVWACVQPELEQQARSTSRWPVLSGFLTAKRQGVSRQSQREDHLRQSVPETGQAERENSRPLRVGRPLRRRLRHMLEAVIAVLVVASLLLGWLAVTRWRSAQGNGPALFTYTSQPHESVYDLQWTPDGKHLVFALSTLTNHYRYLVWDAATGKARPTLTFDLPSSVPGTASAPDGNIITSSDEHYLLISTYGPTRQTGILKLANIMTGQVKQIYQGIYPVESSPAIVQAAFSNNMQYIAFLGADWRIHIWDIAAGKTILTSDPTGLTSGSWLIWSADDKRIILENQHSPRNYPIALQIWNAQTGHRLVNIVETPTMSLFITAVRPGVVLGNLSPDGTRILTYNVQAGTFEERETSTLKILQTFHVQVTETGTEGHVMFIPYWVANGTRLFLVKDQTAYIWDATTGQLTSTISLKGTIQDIKTQPVGRYMALMYEGNSIVIRDIVTGKDVRTITPTVYARLMFWSANGEYLNISDEKTYGQIYNVFTGKLIVSYQGAYWASLSPDRQYIAIPHVSNDPATGDPLKSTVQILSVP